MNFCFDEVIDRTGTNSVKWDTRKSLYGSSDVLPMWIADMDFSAPDPVIDKLNSVLDTRVLGYSLPPESLYEAIIHWQKHRHQMELQKKEILFSPGVVPSIALCIQAFTEEQNAVLIHDPVYYPFSNVIKHNNRKLIRSTLQKKDGQYRMNLEEMEARIKENNVKMFILCNPHNPGGRVWSKEELGQVLELCKKYQVLVLSDEIHGDLIFDPFRFTPAVTVDETYKEFVITLSAATKTFNLAGIKNSMIYVQNAHLRRKILVEQEKNEQNSINTFGYVGTEAAFAEGGPWLEGLLSYLQGNLDIICEFFDREMPEVSYTKPEGTFLFWFDCSSLELNDQELADHFAKVGKIGLNAGHTFGPAGSQHMRFNFASPRPMVEDALQRIKTVFDSKK